MLVREPRIEGHVENERDQRSKDECEQRAVHETLLGHAGGRIWFLDSFELGFYPLVGELEGTHSGGLEVVAMGTAHDGPHDFGIGMSADEGEQDSELSALPASRVVHGAHGALEGTHRRAKDVGLELR